MTTKSEITGYTKVLALIGNPVDHSSSPVLHNTSFDQMGEDILYTVFKVDPEDLPHVVPAMTRMGFMGYNVTIPDKTHICQYLDELTPTAQLMGAVNCVEIKDGKTIGHNTDGAGFMRNIKEHGYDVIGKHMTIVGAGGAGSAIYTAAAIDGVAQIDIFNIKDDFFEMTKAKIAKIAEQTGAKMELHDLADKDMLKKCVDDSVLFVNATRVGMAPLEDEMTLPEEFLHDGLIVADTVYTPRKTKLIRTAEAHGNPTAPGLGMLLWQAAIGEEIWVGKTMDTEYIAKKLFSE